MDNADMAACACVAYGLYTLAAGRAQGIGVLAIIVALGVFYDGMA